MSIDRYLGSAAPRHLELSNYADFDRSGCHARLVDAILMGRATVRNDNPRLLVRSEIRREERTARGLPPSPIEVTVTEPVELSGAPTSSPPARPRRSFTARVRASAMPSRSSEAMRPWSTVVSRCRCADQ
jgi:hypothetical protein